MRDPKVSELIRDLEGQRAGGSEPRRLSATVTSSALPDVAPQLIAPGGQTPLAPVAAASKPPGAAIANEGSILVSKRGRIVRLANEGGRLALAIDNDTNSPAPAPMILQPCRVMQQLEGVSASKGDGVTYRVSGRVMVFEGKNYLLPTFFQLTPVSDITPRQ